MSHLTIVRPVDRTAEATRMATLDEAEEIMRDACSRVSALPGWTDDERATWRQRADRLRDRRLTPKPVPPR